MRHPLVTWLMVGAVLEVMALAAVGLLYVLDLVGVENARDLALKATLAILILAVSGGVVAALLGRNAAPKT
jgi:hypothetical protein